MNLQSSTFCFHITQYVSNTARKGIFVVLEKNLWVKCLKQFAGEFQNKFNEMMIEQIFITRSHTLSRMRNREFLFWFWSRRYSSSSSSSSSVRDRLKSFKADASDKIVSPTAVNVRTWFHFYDPNLFVTFVLFLAVYFTGNISGSIIKTKI